MNNPGCGIKMGTRVMRVITGVSHKGLPDCVIQAGTKGTKVFCGNLRVFLRVLREISSRQGLFPTKGRNLSRKAARDAKA